MMARLQEPQDKKRQMRKRLVLLTLIVLPLISGAAIWILSAAGLIKGPWSSLFGPAFTAVGVVFTVVGVVFTLLQLDRQFPVKTSPKPLPLPMPRSHASSVNFRTETNLGMYRRKGSLFVIGNKRMSGFTIQACPGFDKNDSSAKVASNIVLHKVGSSRTYAAVFPALKPGNYTVFVHPTGPKANVTVQAGQIAEIDWRLYINEKN